MKKMITLAILILSVSAFSNEAPVVSLFADKVPKTLSSQKNFPKVKNGRFVFDGERNFVQFPARPQAASFTYLVWCAPDATAAGSLICKTGWDTLLQLGKENRIYFKSVSDEKKFLTAYSKQVLPTQKWSFVAGVWSGSSLTIFIDGAVSGSLEMSTELLQTDSYYYVGSAEPKSKTPLFYKGLLNGARVWERALSAEEIRDIYEKEKGEYEN